MLVYIDDRNSGQRVDRYLKKRFKNAKLSEIYSLFTKKDVKVNDKRIKYDYILKNGDKLEVYLKEYYVSKWTEKSEVHYSGFIDVVFEDDTYLVVYKPIRLKTTPDRKGDDCLTTRVQAYLKDKITDTYRPSPISRLDYDTSGLVLYIKNYKSMRLLQKSGQIKKKYLAVSSGSFDVSGRVELTIEKNAQKKVSESRTGKKAVTFFNPLCNNKDNTLIDIELLTGRKHQIRFTLARMGYPILGDKKYSDLSFKRFMLESYSISLENREFVFISEEFRKVIRELGLEINKRNNCKLKRINIV